MTTLHTNTAKEIQVLTKQGRLRTYKSIAAAGRYHNLHSTTIRKKARTEEFDSRGNLYAFTMVNS